MSRSVLGGLVGGLLKSSPLAPSDAVGAITNPQGALSGLVGTVSGAGPAATLHKVVSNLEKCDVKSDGICCYFPDLCDPLAQCLSTPNPANVFELATTIPKCLCPSGFTGDGRQKGSGCKNINECETGVALCEHICVDLIPGYRCDCPPGSRLNSDGRTCSDVDECAERLHNCQQKCVNTIGGFECKCRVGYTPDPGDPSKCVDIDECEEAWISGFSVCQFDELCLNIKGTYQCGCPPGMQPDRADPRRCTDADECLELDIPCPNHSVEVAGVSTATQFCENLFAGFQCVCLPGLRQRIDVDDEIPVLEVVPKTRELRLTSDEITERLNRSRHLARTTVCEDIDECTESDDPCALKKASSATQAAECINTFRSYECRCPQGSEFDATLRGCQDIDECITAPGAVPICGIDPHVRCINKQPGYECRCDEGWKLDGRQCVDIDECVTPRCPENANCVNTLGGFSCECVEGFEVSRDGGCLDINECALNFCPAPCINVPGNYVCGCHFGEMADGFQNQEIRDSWSILSNAALPSSGIDLSDPAVQQLVLTTFQKIVRTEVGCRPLDVCAATDGKVCGEGYTCVPGNQTVTCVCPPGNVEITSSMIEDGPEVVALSQKIGSQLKLVPRSLLNRPPQFFLKALATMPAYSSDTWLLTNFDWTTAQRFDTPWSSDVPDTSNTSTLARVMGRLLSRTKIWRCVPADPCLRDPWPCDVRAPCCRSGAVSATRPEGFECLGSRLRLVSGRSQCPPGAITRDDSLRLRMARP